MIKKLLLVLLIAVSTSSFAQIVAGPMLGYSEMREVLLWVQTEKMAQVSYNYWVKGTDSLQYSTQAVRSEKDNYFIVKIVADQVTPGLTYEYELLIDGVKQAFDYPLEFQTQSLWQYRTEPPNFKFVYGSCVYTNEPPYDRPGRAYGENFVIFDEIYKSKPDFMVWGGDNIYLREVDWNTRSGIYKRYIDFKKQDILQPLFANTHHYAAWDDHDYGPNDADRSYWGKNWTLEAFKDNWGNPNYIFEDEATTGTFFWQDVQFFVMDDRWFRAPNYLNDSTKDYYGEKQLNWLIDALASSRAPFKFVVTGGQVVNPTAVFENMSTFPVEHKRLLDKIEEYNISGVLFLSGDRHHTVLRKMDREGTYPLYDVTISSLTSRVASPTDEELLTADLVPNTVVHDLQTYGVFEVSGDRTDRVLNINVIDKNGDERWQYEIRARDLRKPRE